MRFAVTIALAVGMVLSSNAQSQSHDLTRVAEIITEHQQPEIEDHGHVHDDSVDVRHAYLGHAHEMADHDPTIAFLPPRRGTGFIASARLNRSLTDIAIPNPRAFDLDRPPRV